MGRQATLRRRIDVVKGEASNMQEPQGCLLNVQAVQREEIEGEEKSLVKEQRYCIGRVHWTWELGMKPRLARQELKFRLNGMMVCFWSC